MKSTSSSKGSRTLAISAILIVIVAIIGSLVLKTGNEMMCWNIGISMFVYAKLVMVMMFSQGWKALGRKTTAGMPRLMFAFYVILGSLVALLFINNINMTEFPSAQIKIYSVGIAMSASLIGTFIAWYCGVNEWMAKGSEYDARVEFQAKGYSKETIEEKIDKLKQYEIIAQ